MGITIINGSVSSGARRNACGLCHQLGHNRKTCPQGKSSETGVQFAPNETITQKNKRPRVVAPAATAEVDANIGDLDNDDDEELDDADEVEPVGQPTTPFGDNFINSTDNNVENDETEEDLSGNIQWEEYDVENVKSTNFRSGPKILHTQPAFKGRGYGPRNIPSGCSSPFDFFCLLLSDEVCNDFIAGTMGYAEATGDDSFNPTPITKVSRAISLAEIRYYIAIVQFMGVCQLPSREDYWGDSIFKQEFVNLMSMARFESITKNFHSTNTAQFTQTQRDEKKRQDPFWQIQEFLSKLVINFKKYFKVGQYFDIDEMCIYFKGRHICRCYNPSKPEKWHFKSFCLNDAVTGYLWDFFLYRGAKERRPAGIPATAWPVFKLTSDVELWHLNHICCIDNWFNQISVCVELKKNRGIHVDGTVRTNRKGLPKVGPGGLFSKSAIKNKRGIIRALRGVYQQTELFVTCWGDNKPVHVLSTFSTEQEIIERKSKHPQTGAFMKIQIMRPVVIKVYNRGMGGTDLIDALISYYRTRLRAKKWPIRILLHKIQAATANAHMLYNLFKESRTVGFKKLPFKEFITELIIEARESFKVELNQNHSQTVSSIMMSPQSAPSSYQKKSSISENSERFFGEHVPYRSSNLFDSKGKLIRNYRRCAYLNCPNQNTRPQTFCESCGDLPLHIDRPDGGTAQDTCYYKFHHGL